jgi:hypothetical protein
MVGSLTTDQEKFVMILDSFHQDVRVGLRVLFKDKAFCFLAVLVLALGIGGATTQFTVVNAVALRGFSFPHPEQLVSVGLIDPKAGDQNNNFGIGQIPTAQDYEDLKATQKSCSLMAGYLSGSTINVTYKNTPQRYNGGYVTEDFFKITGVSPIIGRDFSAADNKPGAERVVILGHEIWKRDFNGDPGVVGQNVRVNGKPATIIGVMPSKRIGDSRRTRGNTLETCQADVDRKSGDRGIRSSRGSSPGLLGRRLADPRHGRPPVGVRIALLDSIYDRRPGARLHRRNNLGRDDRFRSRPGNSQCPQQCGWDNERRRPRQ